MFIVFFHSPNFDLLWSVSHPGVITVITVWIFELLSLDQPLISAILGHNIISITQTVPDTVMPCCVMFVSVWPPIMSFPVSKLHVTLLIGVTPGVLIMPSIPSIPVSVASSVVTVTMMWSVGSALIEREPLIHLVMF